MDFSNATMLIFLYGADIWRKNHKLKQLTDRFIKEVDPSRINLVGCDPGNTDEAALRSVLRAAPFLARKRMIVLKNFLTQSKRKAFSETLIELLPFLGDAQMVIISEDEGKPKTWSNQATKGVWEYLEKHADGEEFKPLWGAKLEAAIAAQGKVRGLVFEKSAVEFLAVLSGGDLGQSEKEIEKLTAYLGGHPERGEGSRANVCTLNDVKLLCAIAGEASIFEFLDALGTKDQKILLRTAQEQLEEAEPLALVSRATGHLRALLAMTLSGPIGATALKLHPFQAKKISAQLRNWTVPALKRFLFALLTLEYQIKRGLAPDPKAQLTALLTLTLPR